MHGAPVHDVDAARPLSLKQRALDERKAYWLITLYLWLFLGCFTVCRRLILVESGMAYPNYGAALFGRIWPLPEAPPPAKA